MFLIVGLGNPGDQYKNTRHNVGFDIIDLISDKYNISISRIKFKGVLGEGKIAGERCILLKPLTYMNLSGESVIEVANFYKIPKENIIVVFDDVSLDIGRLRIRGEGSAGGHNGVKSIIAHLSSDVFQRIKVGIGEQKEDLVSHVLGRFSKEEREKLEKVFDSAVSAVETLIEEGLAQAMNKYNSLKL